MAADTILRANVADAEALASLSAILGYPVDAAVMAERLESHPFYERMGYVRAKTQHVYRKVLADGDQPAS